MLDTKLKTNEELSIRDKVLTVFILLSSQLFPDNKLIFFPIISIISLILIIISFTGKIEKIRIPTYIYFLFFFVIVTLFYQDQNFSGFIRQFVRLAYPWLVFALYNLLIVRSNRNNISRLYQLTKFTSLSIYIILLPDLFSLIYHFFLHFDNLVLLKLSSVVYRETNTTAFLLFYALVFRLENRIANKLDFFFIIPMLFLTFSRSTIFMFLIYIFYKFFIKIFIPNIKLKSILHIYSSRVFPFVFIFILLFIWRVLNLNVDTAIAYSVSFNDLSFVTRILMFNFLAYYLSNLTLVNLPDLLFGLGWLGYENILENLPFSYEGTTGHTIIGIMPEYGLLYTSFLFIFFYLRAYRGLITDSLLLSIAIIAFFPFPYAAPILCLAHVEYKLTSNRYINKKYH